MCAMHRLTCTSMERIAGGSRPLIPSLSLSLRLNAIPLFQRESFKISIPNDFVFNGFGNFLVESEIFLLEMVAVRVGNATATLLNIAIKFTEKYEI